MFVTLEVSQLSGWLNADAICRESKGGHAMRGGGCGPGSWRAWWGGGGAKAACTRGDST